MTIDWFHGVGQSPVCQILLQIAGRMLVTASPPACINSAGMLSIPADFININVLISVLVLFCLYQI